MANTLLSILVKLGLDTTEYEKGLKDAEGKTKSSTSKMGASFSSIGSSMMKVGGIMTAAVTAPIVAGAMKSIEAASDLNETISKVGVVFGDSAAEVLKFGDSAAQSLGMSKNEALTAAGTFGNLFVAMGMGAKPAADMSTSLIQLAGDLASFNNMDPTEVLEKLRSGLVGETEPLRSLGVNLTADAVKAKAMQMGLAGVTGELSPAALAQARYALILEQTKTAQGDFARTSTGLANQMRIVKAEFADAAAKLGTQLLPLAIQLIGVVSQVVSWFTNLSPAAQKVILVIIGLAAVIGPLLIVLGSLLSAIGAISTFLAGPAVAAIGAAIAAAAPFIAAIAAIIAIVVALIFVWKKNIETMLECWAWVQQTFGPLWQALGNLINAVVNLAIRTMTKLWGDLLQALKPITDWINNKIMPAFKAFADWISSTFGPIIQKAADILRNIFGGAFDWVIGKINELTKWIQDLANWINSLGGGGSDANNISAPNAVTPGVSSVSGGSGGGITNNTYNIFAKETPGQIRQALTLSALMGGAA